MRSNIIERRMSLSPLVLSQGQLKLEALVENFTREALNPQTIAAMTVGSGVFSLLRLGTLNLAGRSISFAINALSYTSAFTAEVIAFRGTHSLFETISGKTPVESIFDGQGFFRTFTDFLSLKIAGGLCTSRNIFLAHTFQSSAMVASRHLNAYFGLLPDPHGSLLEQFVEAEACNMALGMGQKVFALLSGNSLRSLETSFEISQLLEKGNKHEFHSTETPLIFGAQSADQVGDFLRWIDLYQRGGKIPESSQPLFNARYAKLTSKERVSVSNRLYEKCNKQPHLNLILERLLGRLTYAELCAHALEVYRLDKEYFRGVEEASEQNVLAMEHNLLQRSITLFKVWRKSVEAESALRTPELPNFGTSLIEEFDTLDSSAQTMYLWIRGQIMDAILQMPTELRAQERVPFYLEYFQSENGEFRIRQISWENNLPTNANPLHVLRGELLPGSLTLLHFGHIEITSEDMPSDEVIRANRFLMDAQMNLFHGMPLLGFSGRSRHFIGSVETLSPHLLKELEEGQTLIWGIDIRSNGRDFLILMELMVTAIQQRIPLQIAIDLTQNCNTHLRDYNVKMERSRAILPKRKPLTLKNFIELLTRSAEAPPEDTAPKTDPTLSPLTQEVLREITLDVGKISKKMGTPTPMYRSFMSAGGLAAFIETVFASGFFPLHFVGVHETFFGIGEDGSERKMENYHRRVEALRNLGKGPRIIVTFPEMASRGGLSSSIPGKNVRIGIADTLATKAENQHSLFVPYPHLSNFDYIIDPEESPREE